MLTEMAFTASLTSDLTSTDEIIHVDTNTGARTTYPWRAQIDDEILAVTAGVEEGLDWTVLRGADDTDPADHISGTSVIASPLGTVTSEGHIFRDSVDPVTNPDYAPPYIQPGDIWIDTSLGAPFATLVRDSGNAGWGPAPMIRKDLNGDPAGVVLASVEVEAGGMPAVGGIALRTFDALGALASKLLIDADGAFVVANADDSVAFTFLATGAISFSRGSATVSIDAAGAVYIGNDTGAISIDASAGAIVLSGSQTIEMNSTGTFLYLPTADPVAAGALWNDSGTVKVSAG